MAQQKMTTRETAERMAKDRVQLLMSQYPEPNKLRGLKDDQIYAELERCFGSAYVRDVTSISNIEASIKKRIRWFIIGTSVVIVSVLVWAIFQANTVFNAISKGAMDNSVLFPALATVVAIIGVAIYMWKNIRAFQHGNWNIKMGKRR